MDKINTGINLNKDELIKAIQGIVSIKSVMGEAMPGMPFGEGVDRSLKFALDLSNSLGFKTVNLDGYMGYAEYGEGKEMVGVLGHLDVVPEGDGWKYPPFGGEIHDGRIYARGTLDDKGPIIAALFGLKAIKDANLPISKRVRILFGTNEENGCKEVPYYLKNEKAPDIGFTPDAEYPIIYAEKGILSFKAVKKFLKKSEDKIIVDYIKGGNASNMVPDYCEAALYAGDEDTKKYILNKVGKFAREMKYDITYEDKGAMIILKSIGASAHGSLPHLGKNAIMQLLTFISTLDMKGEVKEYIDFFATKIGMETNGKSLGINLKDETGELTLNLGIININEQGAAMNFDIRYPVFSKSADIMTDFNKKAKDAGIEVEDMRGNQPLYFPKDHPLIQTLQKVYREQTGLEPTLLAIGGGTYAKKLPNIVAFGPIFPGKPDLDHQANECIEIEDLIMNAKIYGHSIYELAK